MISDLIPLGNAVAADIREVKEPGLLLPVRKNDETLLITEWGGQMHGVMLTGAHAFVFFPVNLQNPHMGLFVPRPEILVDFSSAAEGLKHEYDEGVLILEQNQLSVVGARAGNHLGNPQKVPLWANVTGGSQAAKAAFTRWGIGIREGNGFRSLWGWQKLAKATVMFSDD